MQSRSQNIFERLQLPVIGVLIAVCLNGCQTTQSQDSAAVLAARLARKEAIQSEAPGNYYIGRRYHTEPTRYWGYIRSPGKGWTTAKLVIMNESIKQVTGRLRLPVENEGAEIRRITDHNFEYKITGYYSGREAYDPTSNMILPEFVLQGYELIDTDPGWLFDPLEISRGASPAIPDPDNPVPDAR